MDSLKGEWYFSLQIYNDCGWQFGGNRLMSKVKWCKEKEGFVWWWVNPMAGSILCSWETLVCNKYWQHKCFDQTIWILMKNKCPNSIKHHYQYNFIMTCESPSKMSRCNISLSMCSHIFSDLFQLILLKWLMWS